MASTSRSFGGAVVTRASSNRVEAAATSATARSNASALTRDGFVVPLILRTYWSAAAAISSSVAGGSKLESGRMFRHMSRSLRAGCDDGTAPRSGRWRGRAGRRLVLGVEAGPVHPAVEPVAELAAEQGAEQRHEQDRHQGDDARGLPRAPPGPGARA